MNYPENVKDIKNLNEFIRKARELETDIYWSDILYDCSSANYADWTRKESRLKWKRDMIQKYLNYKNKIEEAVNTKIVNMNKLPYIEQELESRSESEYYKKILDKYNASKTKRIKLSYSELDDISAIYSDRGNYDEISKVLYGTNKLQESLPLDWNNYLTTDEIINIIGKKDKYQAALNLFKDKNSNFYKHNYKNLKKLYTDEDMANDIVNYNRFEHFTESLKPDEELSVMKLAKKIHDKYVNIRGGGVGMSGYCLDATDDLIKALNKLGYKAKPIDGYAIYENIEDSIDTYAYHTLVSVVINNETYYIDVTCEQFEPYIDACEEDTIIFQKYLPDWFSLKKPKRNYYESKTLNKLTLYHNTSNENAIKINKEGIIPGLRKDAYGKGSEAEATGIWCSTKRGYGYGGATITFEVDFNDKDLVKENDTEYMLYRKVDPKDIIDIDLMISDIRSNSNRKGSDTSTVESDIPQAIKYFGKEKVLKVFSQHPEHFVEPYNFEQLQHLIDTGEKYCKGRIKIVESINRLLKKIPEKQKHKVKDFYKDALGQYTIDLNDGYETSYGTNYIQCKTIKDCLHELEEFVSDKLNENKTIQGLENYSEEEIKNLVERYIKNILADSLMDYDIFDIVDIQIHGSRTRGTAKDNSDLDVVVEYIGDFREDDLFNLLNDDPLYIEDIQVDINPIRAEETGTMSNYMKKSDEYDKEILSKKQEKVETKVVDMNKLPYIQQELESRSESEYYKNILDKYNKSKSKRVKLSYSELDDISAIYNGDEEIQKLLYGNKLQEKASIDWNNYLTHEEIKKFLSKNDKIKSAENIIYSKEFEPRYKDLHNSLQAKYKNSWTKKELVQDLNEFYNFGHLITESKHKLEEKSRNELLAKTKSQTVTRYDKAAGYKGFYIYDIDTTNIFNKNSNLLITCKVGDYHSQVEIENTLWWVEYEVDERGHDTQITTKYVTQALMDAIDGMNIKVNCECGDWIYRMKYQATQYGYNYGRPENRPAKITNPNDIGALCFTKDTLVLTKDGLIPIQNIKIGDLVFTHKGRLKPVTNIGHRNVDKIIEFKIGTETIQCTEEHPFLACNDNGKNIHWEEAQNLNKNYNGNILAPVLQFNSSDTQPNNYPFILGLYLADGSFGYRSDQDNDTLRSNVRISINHKFKYIYDEIFNNFNLEYSYTHNNNSNSAYYTILNNRSLRDYLIKYGGFNSKGKMHKFLSDEVLNWSIQDKINLLQGFFIGDGQYGTNGKYLNMNFLNTNKDLLWKLNLILKSLGIHTRWITYKRKPRYIANNKNISYAQDMYHIRITGLDLELIDCDLLHKLKYEKTQNYIKSKYKARQVEFDNIYYFINKIKDKEIKQSSYEVFNLSVADDDSYLITREGLAVHNCKHLTAMLSNKKWIQQVTSTLMDYIVKNIDKVNQFLNRKPGQELTVPNEAQRRLGKQAAYSKVLSRQEVLQNVADDFIKEVGDKVLTQNINLDDNLRRFINNSDDYSWQKIQPNEFRVIKGYIDDYISKNKPSETDEK